MTGICIKCQRILPICNDGFCRDCHTTMTYEACQAGYVARRVAEHKRMANAHFGKGKP